MTPSINERRNPRARGPEKHRPGLLWLLAVNFFTALVIAAGYLPHVELPPAHWPILAVQTAGNFGLLILLLGLILWLLRFAIPSQFAFKVAAAVLCGLAQILLFADVTIYHLFRCHINGMVLTDITTPGAGESIHLGILTVLTFLGVVAAVAALQILILFPGEKFLFRHPRLGAGWLRKAALLAVLAAIAADKAMYALGDLYYRPEFFKYTRILPLYVPLTIEHFAAKHLGIYLKRSENISFSPETGLLHYPPVGELPRAKKWPNIVLFILDSWRFDQLDPETTPALWEFGKKCTWFRRHFTGGISTRYGIFSLLYGLHPTYWDVFLGENRGTALIDVLKREGYDFCIVSSTKLTFPEFWKTAFISIPESIHDELPGEESWQRDELQPGTLFKFLDDRRDKAKPFFAFLFIDSPHSPYSYPPAYEKFKPAARNVNYLDIKKGGGIEYYNRYRNASNFSSERVGKDLLEGLAARGLMDSTAVFITGDHGEEFWESGNWGHTSAFSLQQCSVPMLLYVPGRNPARVSYPTSHLDFVPTVFDLLGLPGLIPEYTVGRSLLRAGPRDFWGVTGFREAGVFMDNRVVVYGMHFRNSADVEVRDWKYRPVADPQAELKKDRPILRAFLEEQRRFLR